MALSRRALSGGRASGRDFWHRLQSCMEHLGFQLSKVDLSVWYRSTKRKNGTPYYEYVLLDTDDCLVISNNAEIIVRNEIEKYFKLKEKSIGDPLQYLGAKLHQIKIENGIDCWGFSSTQYVHDAVTNDEQYLKLKDEKLVAKALAPFKTGYCPQIDVTKELREDDATYYQSLIGVLRWIVEF